MPAPVCADEIGKLYETITALQAGKAVASIGFGERQVSYVQGDLPALMRLWSLWYRQCGAASGYPDLAAGIERGGPAISRLND